MVEGVVGRMLKGISCDVGGCKLRWEIGLLILAGWTLTHRTHQSIQCRALENTFWELLSHVHWACLDLICHYGGKRETVYMYVLKFRESFQSQVLEPSEGRSVQSVCKIRAWENASKIWSWRLWSNFQIPFYVTTVLGEGNLNLPCIVLLFWWWHAREHLVSRGAGAVTLPGC